MFIFILLLYCQAETNQNNIEIWTDFNRLWQTAGTYLFKDMNTFTKINIITMGKSRYDKKTLINSMYGEKIADTKYENEQEGIEIYTKKDNMLSVYDTIKIKHDLSNADVVLNEAYELIDNLTKTNDPNNNIHYFFYVVSCEYDYLDEKERIFINNLASDPHFKNIKIIIVLTQCAFENQYHKMIRKIGKTNLTIVPYLAKMKKEITADKHEIVYIQPYGLNDLVNEMIKSFPDILYNYYENFKSEKIKLKRKYAAIAVGSGTLVSTLSTFIPNPLAKYSLLGLSEIGMLYAIKRIYEIDININIDINKILNINIDEIKDKISNKSTILGAAAGLLGIGYAGSKDSNTTCKETSSDSTSNLKEFTSKCSEFIKEYNLFSAPKVGISTLAIGSTVSIYADYLYRQTFVSKAQFDDYIKSISKR